VCAQGAAPVGPAFEVTKARNNLVLELGGRPAVERLTEVARSLEGDKRTLALLRRALLVGVSFEAAEGEGDAMKDERDFLIRQVLGSEASGGIYIGDAVRVGMQLRFHVRDELAAQEDLKAVLGRYKLQRQFSGRFTKAGAPVQPLASFQFSCNGRGSNMYSKPNFDLNTFRELVSDVPTGGFFCNGELAPVGASGLDASPSPAPRPTHLHGFTSVWALIYDTTPEA